MPDPRLLTAVLLVLTAFLFLVVFSYTRRYLQGNPGERRFRFWLCFTAACVFTLVAAQNLLLFAAAWCATSLGLHQLLQFYRDRPAALRSARKKFMISRLGDCALGAALWLVQTEFGTLDFETLFRAVGGLEASPPPAVHWIAGLLVFAALLKSAQFPFHSWLPDTMETPTPVSALMHAGIINAGGILVIRMSPLISLSLPALQMLCLVGGFTALFASTVMLTQASVKRCLAFSTVAQMGFMMLECGLGAYHLALVHLVGHSLYKAHAFLSTGTVVTRRTAASPLPMAALGAGLIGALVSVGSVSSVTGMPSGAHPALMGIFTLALAQMLGGFWRSVDRGWQVPLGVALGAAATLTYFWLETAASRVASASSGPAPGWPGLVLLALFAGLAVAQTQLTRLAETPFGLRLYVHARNGFYLNTLANRVTEALWPVRMAKEKG